MLVIVALHYNNYFLSSHWNNAGEKTPIPFYQKVYRVSKFILSSERNKPLPPFATVAGPSAVFCNVQWHSPTSHADHSARGASSQRMLLGKDDADRLVSFIL